MQKKEVYFLLRKKIEEGRTIISSIPTSQLNEKLVESWDNLALAVPNTDGGSNPNKLFTNDEKQKVLLKRNRTNNY